MLVQNSSTKSDLRASCLVVSKHSGLAAQRPQPFPFQSKISVECCCSLIKIMMVVVSRLSSRTAIGRVGVSGFVGTGSPQ